MHLGCNMSMLLTGTHRVVEEQREFVARARLDVTKDEVSRFQKSARRPDCIAANGPLRRFAALRDDGRSRSYCVCHDGSSREGSVSEVLRESTERCSRLPLTHCGRRGLKIELA